jgi:alpha-tubulin suppressor-like RCC1 family protein
LAVLLAAACGEGPERDGDTPRFNIPPPPDASDEAAPLPPPAGDASSDATHDGAADVDAGPDPGPTGARALATGSGPHDDPLVGNGDHSCAIAGAARSIYCWGANDHGQLGLGTTGAGGAAADVSEATRIAIDETGLPLEGVEELALAGFHGCARRGEIPFCWGQRLTGAQAEPPLGANPDRTRPRAIGNLAAVRLGAGGPHTCVLKTNGKIACFGHSTFNQLGRPNPDDETCSAPFFRDYQGNATHTCSGTLVEANAAIPSLVRLSLGEVHTCALALGRVYCFGTNLGGELGRPGGELAELNAQLVVTDPEALTPLVSVSAIASGGGGHTCALRQGQVHCWGRNDAGQLGADPAVVTARAYAAAVPGLATAKALGAADRVTCVARVDGTASCWGKNDAGQLGDGTTTDAFVPVQVKGPGGVGVLTGVVDIAPGVRHVCALRDDATVWCWGNNDRGQLGDGTTTSSPYPVKVVGLPP